MRGSKSLSARAVKRAFLLAPLSLGLMSTLASAHIPLPSQIVRYQAGLLRNSKPFEMKGSVESAVPGKMTTYLEWSGVNSYELVISNVPHAFYTVAESASSKWVLIRKGSQCVLKTESFVVSCNDKGFWAALELSGSPDQAAEALVNIGLLDSAEAVFTETNSKDPPAQKRVRLELANQGNKPVAVLELRPPGTLAGADVLPMMQFNQTFLSPHFAKLNIGTETFSISALTDTQVRKGNTRFDHVFASRLDVLDGKILVARFHRQLAKPLLKPEKPAALPKALTDVNTLSDALTPEGRAFLRALLLTH